MVATACLLTAALLTGQVPDRSEWQLAPRLARGQELVYGGTYTEQVLGQGVQFNRTYRLEATAFVLGPTAQGYEAAFLTVLELNALRPERGSTAPPPRSVRLELARVSFQGRVEGADGAVLLAPLDGPPTAECGAFVEVPRTRVGRDSAWQVTEAGGRPPRTWRVVGTEAVNGSSCVKLIGRQQSEDWDLPRADRTAWRRTDMVWLSPALGVAVRVDRVVERREPARQEPTQRAVVRYEMLSRPLTYPAKLYDDRRREILAAHRFAAEAAPFLRQPGPYADQLAAVGQRIAYHLENQPPVEPYRKAIVQVKQRVEAARRGEVPPEPPPEEGPPPPPAAAAVGRRAPDFVATALTQPGSVHLRRLLGRPTLLVFYSPSSVTAREVLRFANDLTLRGVTVLGLAVSDDPAAVRRQHAELRLRFPVVAGKGFRASYGVDATPRLIVLDAGGTVRGTYTGWGGETPREISVEIKRWLPPRAQGSGR